MDNNADKVFLNVLLKESVELRMEILKLLRIIETMKTANLYTVECLSFEKIDIPEENNKAII